MPFVQQDNVLAICVVNPGTYSCKCVISESLGVQEVQAHGICTYLLCRYLSLHTCDIMVRNDVTTEQENIATLYSTEA